jgi:hypothetical protein
MVTRPITHNEWQILRVLVRAKNHPKTGLSLRLAPTRVTRDGTFLTKLVESGILEVVKEGEVPPRQFGDEPERPVAFYATYRLTDKGKHAAEYGECEFPLRARKE